MKFWFHTSFAISAVQSCLKALFLALEKMTQGFRAEEAQTGEVEKEAEEEKRRQRIKEGMYMVMYKDYTIEG